jgi:hypothetical protein
MHQWQSQCLYKAPSVPIAGDGRLGRLVSNGQDPTDVRTSTLGGGAVHLPMGINNHAICGGKGCNTSIDTIVVPC